MPVSPRHFIAPAAALVLSAIWIASQNRILNRIETANASLHASIATAQHRSNNQTEDPDPSMASRLRQGARHSIGGIDWKRIAATQASMQSGDGIDNIRIRVALQKTLQDLSAAEIAAGLDEIAGLDIADEVRRDLESMLIGILAEQDPQLALDRFSDRLTDVHGALGWQLSAAFQQWSTKDPMAAAAWMDGRIAEGIFDSKSLDGKNPNRFRFEASLIQTLLGTDPAAAAKRLADIPEGHRADVFAQHAFFRVKPGQGKAVADLIRNQIPELDRLNTLARTAAPMVHQGGYEKVASFLGEIQPSADERAAIVAESVKDMIRRRDNTPMEETRAWILAQAPRDAERLSGEALAEMAGGQDFSKMAELALQYRQSSGSDDALVAFLKNAPSSSRFEILELAEQIADPAQRDEVTRRFINNPNRNPSLTPPAD